MLVRALPLSKSEEEEKLRAYHARLDLMSDMFSPDEENCGWQIEHIDKHLVKKKAD